MNRLTKNCLVLLKPISSTQIKIAEYSSKTKNILRNRYSYRNKDGTYKEFNESITIVPKELEQQDEYKLEKKTDQIYHERFKKHQKMKESLYTLKLSKSEVNEELTKVALEDQHASNKCEHSELSDGTVALQTDPYQKKQHQCIFCKYNVPLDYKNVQLLSQFVSPHTGTLYSQEVTGLCYFKYRELENTLFKSRKLGLMPFFYKETLFVNDPQLFDPFKNNLKPIPNNYDNRKLNADPVQNNNNSNE
ncbi:unnamed protein product [Brachionus calyciflorus]|uniref:28S ribosomal protein S18b, mitochondrial n=1 Tax=Brachionus calyciflorus TaxID=104777 RepID=A0A813T0A9_9BILA|nr:unnamed protein product [Brachionus calyciflorus]